MVPYASSEAVRTQLSDLDKTTKPLSVFYSTITFHTTKFYHSSLAVPLFVHRDVLTLNNVFRHNCGRGKL